MQVNETLAQSPAVVAGGDAEQAGGVYGGGDCNLGGIDDRLQVAAVDDDLHH